MIEQIKNAIRIVTLDREKMASVSGSVDAKKWGILIFVAAPVVNLFLASLIFPSGFSAIFSRFLLWPVLLPSISLVGAIFAMSFALQKLFKKGSEHLALFRVLSYASIVLWLSVIPFLFDLLGLLEFSRLFVLIVNLGLIWIFVVASKFIVEHFKVNQQELFFTILIGAVSYLLLHSILGNILVGSYYRVFY